jgi:hypothetical protein
MPRFVLTRRISKDFQQTIVVPDAKDAEEAESLAAQDVADKIFIIDAEEVETLIGEIYAIDKPENEYEMVCQEVAELGKDGHGFHYRGRFFGTVAHALSVYRGLLGIKK